jgi:hypothetical protein
MPIPQAIGVSSDTTHGTRLSWANAAVAAIIGSGPHATIRGRP